MEPLSPPIHDDIPPPIAWRASSLPGKAGQFPLPQTVLDELRQTVEVLRVNPLPLLALRPDDFSLTASRQFMAAVRQELDEGVGFAIVDRLPIDDVEQEEAKALYWLLGALMSRPVAQKWNGTMIYDVHDTGQQPGNGVRPDLTNVEQNFHTDNSYNHCAPHYVALLCLQRAKSGGMSELVSFATAHNELRRAAPALLARLYGPFWFDRQREHAPDDPRTVRHAMFENHAGRLVARLSRYQVLNGYQLAGESLDTLGAQALDALESIMSGAGTGLDFWFEPGQMQWVNNRLIGHRRTAFTDWPEPERRRRLVRLWLRDTGRTFYGG